MGRRLDVLLGRTTKQTARLRSLLGLAVTRLGVLRAHREVRCAQARGDVEQLLRLGRPDRALHRAEQVVRERDMLDALLMLRDYCALLVERAALIDDARGGDCPAELREAAAGLVYAAARCGDLPELQEVRTLLAAKFGREFVSSAAELRSGCGINTKIVQKMSTKQPSLESRQMVLQEIAAEAGIDVHVSDLEPPCEGSGSGSSSSHRKKKHDDERHRPPAPQVDTEEDVAAGADSSQRYRDVEAAAQAAFESAATAAAAAKAAMELSRGESREPDGRRKAGKARTVENQREVLNGGEDFVDATSRGDIAESELKQPEVQPDPARSRPASVRTRR